MNENGPKSRLSGLSVLLAAADHTESAKMSADPLVDVAPSTEPSTGRFTQLQLTKIDHAMAQLTAARLDWRQLASQTPVEAFDDARAVILDALRQLIDVDVAKAA